MENIISIYENKLGHYYPKEIPTFIKVNRREWYCYLAPLQITQASNNTLNQLNEQHNPLLPAPSTVNNVVK